MALNPVPMTIHDLVRQLTVVLEKSTPEERQLFKQSWLEGAARLNAENQRLRDQRFLRSVGIRP